MLFRLDMRKSQFINEVELLYPGNIESGGEGIFNHGRGGGYRHSLLTIYLSYLSIWTICSTNVHSNPLLPTTLNTPVGWHASCVINSCVVMPEFNIVVAVALLSQVCICSPPTLINRNQCVILKNNFLSFQDRLF